MNRLREVARLSPSISKKQVAALDGPTGAVCRGGRSMGCGWPCMEDTKLYVHMCEYAMLLTIGSRACKGACACVIRNNRVARIAQAATVKAGSGGVWGPK